MIKKIMFLLIFIPNFAFAGRSCQYCNTPSSPIIHGEEKNKTHDILRPLFYIGIGLFVGTAINRIVNSTTGDKGYDKYLKENGKM